MHRGHFRDSNMSSWHSRISNSCSSCRSVIHLLYNVLHLMLVYLQEQRAAQVAQQLAIQDQQVAQAQEQQQLRQQLQVSHPSSLIMILNLIVIVQAQQVAQGADQAQEDEQFRQQLQVSHPFPLLIILNLISIQAQQVAQDQAQHQQLSQEQAQQSSS